MSEWKKHASHDTERLTIGPKSRVPLYVVGSAISLAIYGTVLYERLSYQIQSALTVEQAQTWIDNAREANHVAYPSFVFPRIPPKESSNDPKPEIWTQTQLP